MTTIPLQTRLPKTHRIVSIKQETENVRTLTFDVSFGAKPGQFLMIWLPGFDEVPMSVAFDNGVQTKITFFAVGDLTKELAKQKEGDLVGLRGPFGTHYKWQKGQHLILVAGGYGAAPMHFVAHEAVKDDCTIDFIVGARSSDHLLYIDEIESLSNTTLHIATDDGSKGHKGYNTEILEDLLPSVPSPNPPVLVFACGPEMMMKRISDICAENDIRCSMSLERFMKCGFGLCGNCVMDPLGIRMCIDGPVISNDIIQKLTEFGSYHRDDVGKKHKL